MSKRGKYGKWSEEELQMAVAAYKNHVFGLNECERVYGVPKATIKRHSDQKNAFACEVKLFGRPSTFNEDMEKQLVKHILELESMFFGFTIYDIRKLAYDIADKFSLQHNFDKEKKIAGKKWFYSFMRRNPELSLRQPEATSMARAKGFNKENVMGFFDLLEKIVDDYKLDGTRIFNVDESGFTTVQKKPQKVLSLKGKRQVGAITSGERGVNTTIVCCTNAAGLYIPPMIIFKRKRKLSELEVGAPSGSIIEISDTGYINSELFLTWLKHFYSVVKPSVNKPILLLLDGHTTHSKNLEALLFAKEHGIILLQLPGHTTHRLQPLDVAFFKPLGLYYIQSQEKWLRQNYGKTISQFQVTGLLKEAYGRAASIAIAENAFKSSGIWPVNRNIFQDHNFVVSNSLNRAPTPTEDTIDCEENIESDLPEKKTDCEKNVTNIQSKKISFASVLEKVSPIPKTVSSKQKRSRGAQKAVILTSSPYKNQLEERARPKVTSKLIKKELFPKDKKCPVKIKKEKTEETKKRKTKSIKEQNNQPKKKKTEDLQSTSKTAKTSSVSWYCPLCQEEKMMSMIMCRQCSTWFHEECLGIEKGDEFSECHWCTGT